MVPIKIKLRNFMTYRHEVSLDFQGIHLAVLSGENGAGKSSLLDAITWALWGRARAKRDDDLIHLGCTEMEVEYVFSLGDNAYSVIRKRDSSRRGRSDLSLRVQDAGGWRMLTETSIRATQDKINSLLRLDYETFVNSAFLLQGRADEFTTKPPGKRKEILSDILGLHLYEIYAERAKKRVNQKKEEEAVLKSRIEQMEQELAQEPKYREELASAQLQAEELRQQLRAAEDLADKLRSEYQAIEYKQHQLDQLQERQQGIKRDLDEITAVVVEAEVNLARYQAILGRRPEIEAGQAELKRAREAVKEWDIKLQESSKLSVRQHELDRAFQAARSEIEARLREINTLTNLYRPKTLAVEDQRRGLAAARAELEQLTTLEREQQSRRDLLARWGAEAAQSKEQNRQLKLEMDDIKAKLTQLEQAGSICPVCQRPLEEEHRLEVLAQFRRDGKTKGDTYRANTARLQEIENQQNEQQRLLRETEQKLRLLPNAQRQVAVLEQSLAEAEEAAVRLAEAETKRSDLQEQLDSQAFAADVVADLAEVRAELASLGYDSAAHGQVRSQVENLLHFEEENRSLAEAERGLVEVKKQLEREKTRHERLLAQGAADRQRMAELEQETAGLPALSQKLNEANLAVDDLFKKERLARDKVVAAEQKLNHVAYIAKKRGEEEERLGQVREVLGIYRELQVAFGKNGVQALLIESAVPEIEDEANRLLARMTDSRMQVRFETQREARSGENTIETLDIRISDEIGTRDYELYSGGEAFRVNFAIRVAMSKVLARRAGARLQTLIIDEGFGTQDGQGRERLVEAINAIQNDFEKIVVITHIDELKDAFPVRIEVWKTAEGSKVAIR